MSSLRGETVEIITKRGAVRCVCEVCGKDRTTMFHCWNGKRWYDYCELHWDTEVPECRQTNLIEFGVSV